MTGSYRIQTDEECSAEQIWDALHDYADAHPAPTALRQFVDRDTLGDFSGVLVDVAAGEAARAWLTEAAAALGWSERTTPVLVTPCAELVSPTTLGDALRAAIAEAERAEQAWLDDESCLLGHDLKCSCASSLATRAADAAVVAARAALRDSDEPRTYAVRYLDGSGVTTEVTCTPDELDQAVEDDVRSGDWGADESSIYVDVEVTSIDGAEERRTVAIHPQAPDCADDHEHDWGSGHGGVRTREACAHCGVYRSTDHGASRPDNGTRCTAVSYEPADDESLVWVAGRQATAMKEACCYSVTERDGRYWTSIDTSDYPDESAQDAELALIQDSLPGGWTAAWTGDGSGTDLDVEISRDTVIQPITGPFRDDQ